MLSPIIGSLIYYYGCLDPFLDYELFQARQHVVGELGVDEATIRAGTGILSVRRVWFDGVHFDQEPIEGAEAEMAVVGEVKDADGETTIDLFAWRLDHPEKVATLTGRPRILGLEQLEHHVAIPDARPLKIHRTITDWLRAWCRGIVPTDMRRCARLLLEADCRLEAADDAHGLELQAAMRALVDVNKIVVADGVA